LSYVGLKVVVKKDFSADAETDNVPVEVKEMFKIAR
jgi:hypothetical protein